MLLLAGRYVAAREEATKVPCTRAFASSAGGTRPGTVDL